MLLAKIVPELLQLSVLNVQIQICILTLTLCVFAQIICIQIKDNVKVR